MRPEQLLFTDFEGAKASLQDVIDEGFDCDYSDRLPKLLNLTELGTPYHQLLACITLVSWGDVGGFELLLKWATIPSSVPWASDPVSYDRLSNRDDAFAKLAEAVETSGATANAKVIEDLRRSSYQALLQLYSHSYFGRSLGDALRSDQEICSSIQPDIEQAITRCLKVSIQDVELYSYLPFQITSLIGALARIDDRSATVRAVELMQAHPKNERMLRELSAAMAYGKGGGTRRVLERLANSPIQSVAKEARATKAKRVA